LRLDLSVVVVEVVARRLSATRIVENNRRAERSTRHMRNPLIRRITASGAITVYWLLCAKGYSHQRYVSMT
jgi:hypothetical protein